MIKILVFSIIFISFQIKAAEVATMDLQKSSNEIVLILTDTSLQTELEKYFIAHNCRLQFGMNTIATQIRENRFTSVCKASVIQFLLNKGYKPSMDYKVFTKN